MAELSLHQLNISSYDPNGNLPGLVIRVEHVTGDVLPHSHADFYELVVVRDGEAVHHRDDCGDSRLFPGNVFLVPPGVTHNYSDYHSLSLINMLLRTSFMEEHKSLLESMPGYAYLLPDAENKLELVSLAPEYIIPLIQLGDLVMEEQCHQRPGQTELVSSLLMQSLILVLRNCDYASGCKHSAGFIVPIVNFLTEHCEEHFNLKQLAKMAHSSVPAFCRNFKKEVGCSPIEYTLRLRIEKAKSILSGKFYTISTVAERLGFSDINYFTRQFRKRVGCSPSQWSSTPHGLGVYPKKDIDDNNATKEEQRVVRYRQN